MKITTLRKLLILSNLLLAAGIGLTIKSALDSKRNLGPWKTREQRQIEVRLEKIQVVRGPQVRRVSYGALKSAGNLLAHRRPKPVKKTVSGPVRHTEDKSPLATKVEVLSIKAGFNGYAYLKPAGRELVPMEQRFFGPNEAITFVEGATVKRLERERVICSYRGKEVALKLKQDAGAKSAPPSGSGSVRPLRNYVQGITVQPNTNLVVITRPAMAGLRQAGTDEALKGVVWGTVTYTDGKPAVQVKKLPPGGVLKKGGLKQGDTLISINGRRVTSKAQIVAYVRANPNLPRYTVKMLRGGRVFTRTVTPKRSP